jgi:integrase
MGLYRQKRSKVWWMSYVNLGRQVRKSTGTCNKKIAETIYYKIKTQIAEGVYLNGCQGKNKTFGELVKRYLKEVSPNKKPGTQRDDRSHAKRLVPAFGNRKLNEISPDLLSRYILKRKKKVGPSTINRDMAFISAAFNQGIKVWGWCRDNPVSCIKREKETKRVKYFSEKEFSEIYDHLTNWVKPFVLIAKNTGLRKSNIVFLKWSEVNLKDRIIILKEEATKNSEHLGVPLNTEAWQVLKDQMKQRKLHSPYVFCKEDGKPYTGYGVYQAFKRACKKAGHPDFRFHDLRHDFCSKLVQAGVDLYTVKELAGHKDITTTQRYAHLNRGKLKSAVEVLEKNIILLS